MAWVFFVLGALIVFAIAFYAVGRATGEMASQRPPAIYELPVAVDWIADRLPDEVTARISYDDVTGIRFEFRRGQNRPDSGHRTSGIGMQPDVGMRHG